MTKIENLKKGDLFTLKPIASPKESQVYTFHGYDRMNKKYIGVNAADISASKGIKKGTKVYTNFNF